MTGHSCLILIPQGKGNESLSSGEAARKEGHPEIYDYVQKELSSANPQEFMTLIDGPTSELLDYRDRIKKLCQQASSNTLKLYTSVLTFGNEVNPFLERIVTGGEKFVKYRPTRRELRSSTPLKEIIELVLVCVWWDMSGIIFYELLEPGQTVNAAVYCGQLERVQQELIRRGCVLVNNRCRILQHNNATPYTAKMTREKIRKLGFECLPHPPNSKNLLPSHYHLFKSLEETLSGELTSVEEVKTHVDKFLKDKPKDFFEEGIKQLPSRWKEVLET